MSAENVSTYNISLTESGSSWVVNISGGLPTIANLGSGVGIFEQISGGGFQLKSLVQGSGIGLTPTSTEIEISITGDYANGSSFLSHTNDSTIHFTEASIDKYTQGEISSLLSPITTATGNLDVRITSVEGVTGSFSITGHTHDDRYYTEGEIDSLFVAYTETGEFSSHTNDSTIHFTEASIDKYTQGEVNSIVSPLTVATGVLRNDVDNNDLDISGLQSVTGTFSITGHTHDDRYYTESETNALLTGKFDATGVFREISFAASDEKTVLEVEQVLSYRQPFDFIATTIYASLVTAPTTSAVQVDIKNGGDSIISTGITFGIDTGVAEINGSWQLSKNDLITTHVIQADVAAAGLKIWIL